MSSILDAYDTPERYQGHGLDLSFPKLDIDDHVAWCADLHAARKPAELKLIPGNAAPVDRFRMQRFVEHNKPTIDNVADLIYTAEGARECLRRSLVKAGMPDAEAAATLKKIPPGRIQSLAIDVSGLFERTPAPAAGAGQSSQGTGADNPLAPAAAAGGATAGSTSTGPGPGSSSPSTGASPSEPSPSPAS
jgi:hypothetical protein